MTSSSKEKEKVRVRNDGKKKVKTIHEECSFLQLQIWVFSYVVKSTYSSQLALRENDYQSHFTN